MGLLGRGATFVQIEQLERVKTSEDRWREATTPPQGPVAFGLAALGAVMATRMFSGGARVPAAVLGALGANFLVNTLREDAEKTAQELRDSVTDPITTQTSSTGKVINSLEGGDATPDAVDVANTLIAGMDGVGVVQSVAHRNDPVWHPYGDTTLVETQSDVDTLAAAGVGRHVGDTLFEAPVCKTVGDTTPYRTHWYQFYYKRPPPGYKEPTNPCFS